jgi:hypothetical protein
MAVWDLMHVSACRADARMNTLIPFFGPVGIIRTLVVRESVNGCLYLKCSMHEPWPEDMLPVRHRPDTVHQQLMCHAQLAVPKASIPC